MKKNSVWLSVLYPEKATQINPIVWKSAARPLTINLVTFWS